jgi:uncharacterized protein (TIGR03083 family)
VQHSPRYEGSPLISIDDAPDSQLAPAARQRRRLEDALGSLDDDQWAAPTRCEGWDVADVVAHLISVNNFWTLSIAEGLAGRPTRYLEHFDPAVTPGELVAGARGTPPPQLLDQLVTSNDRLLNLVGQLDDPGWSKLAECPVGHLPVRLVLQHGLWDGWVHERDIVLPLGLTVAVEPDEVISSLVYASALSPAFALIRGDAPAGQFALVTDSPPSAWVLEVDDRVTVRPGVAAPATDALAGAAVDLAEALSLRAPLPSRAPERWRRLVAGGLAAAFGVDSQRGATERP